ncbi:MAG: hypothetical protein LCH20_00170 [Proteobacteria bacterium]|nr:hypothetical protein [Pseudomonadota bacterium]
MTITKETLLSNSGTDTRVNTQLLGSENLVPNWWYKAIKNECGKPDLVAITILSELWFLYRKGDGREFSEGYSYFERKFGFTRSQLQEATLRLHSSDIAIRTFRTVVVHGRNFPNELHLKINLPKLLSLKSQYIVSSDEGSSDNADGDFFHNDVLGNSYSNTSEKTEKHISKREISIRKNRSIGSNFSKERYGFAFFYPLSQSDIESLRGISGREFSARAMNEILLLLTKKLPNHTFPNKSAFLNYMAKALAYEMRDAVKTSNETFRIKSHTKSDQELEQEKYLASVEDNRNSDSETRIRKKIASLFSKEKAYEILTSLLAVRLTGDGLVLQMKKNISLSSYQETLLLNEIRSVYGSEVDKFQFNIEPQEDKQISIKALAKAPESYGIWGCIRNELKKSFGNEGEAIDKNWFSKLSVAEDKQTKSLTLQAPSEFVKDWISARYSSLIEKQCQAHNYNLQLV